MFPRDVDHQLTLANVVREGLLDVDLLAGKAALDRLQAVPVLRRRHHNRVDGAIVEKTTIIPDEPRRGLLLALDTRPRRVVPRNLRRSVGFIAYLDS